jgi:cytochrome b subunit of formate dehydrogenase
MLIDPLMSIGSWILERIVLKHVVILVLAGLLFPPLVRAQSDEDCLMCHSDASLSMTKKGRTISLFVDGKGFASSAHGALGCAGCHEGFKPSELPHKTKISPVKCLNCHEGDQFSDFAESVHGRSLKGNRPAASCADCHTAHSIKKVTDQEPVHRAAFAESICAKCHGDINVRFLQSDHGVALARGVKGAPSCIDCHGEHAVQSVRDSSSSTAHGHQARMCLSCHLDKPEVRERVGPSAGFVSSYEMSVHGQAVKAGNDSAATCTDCHGSHNMKKGSNPSSSVAKKNIAGTCAKCHSETHAQYVGSIHGQALAKGVTASPTCTDCHGEHNILSPQDARSPVAAANVSSQVCSPCHGSVKLTQKYGLAGDRFQSFEDSFHGLAQRAGSVEVANCASCHGVHDIKPSTDPSSRISPENLIRTCGTCHPGANTNFTRGSVHVIATSGQDGVLYFVSNGYIVLIVVLIGGMFAHNLLDFIRKSRRQLQYRRGELPRKHTAHRLYLRMTLSERIQHGTLLVSFITLVLTGFALRYPDAWWVAPVRSVSPWMFELRGILHRIAAVAMVAASLYHCWYLFFVPRGKELFRDLLPRRQDLFDALNVLKYNFGISPEKPKFGRFSYIEKSEYWALVWGTFVMGLTGVILWFDNIFLGLLTKLWWDVARTVHYYEAWLATLAIIVWHFYFVIFNPDTYPINLAFWKGTLTEEEMEEEHPLELETYKRRQHSEEPKEEKV